MLKKLLTIALATVSLYCYAEQISPDWTKCSVVKRWGTINVMSKNTRVVTIASHRGKLDDIHCKVTDEGLQVDTVDYFKNSPKATIQLNFEYSTLKPEQSGSAIEVAAEIKGNTSELKGKLLIEGWTKAKKHFHTYEGYTTRENFSIVKATMNLPVNSDRIRVRADIFSPGIYTIKNVTVSKPTKINASIISNKWKVLINPGSYSNFNKIPATRKAIDVVAQDNTINIAKVAGKLTINTTALLFTEFNSPEEAEIFLGLSADWWMEVYLNGKQVYSTMNKGNGTITFSPHDHYTKVQLNKGKNILAAKVKSGSGGWKFCYGVPYHKNIVFKEDDKWKAVDMSDLRVQKNSILDLSNLTEGKMERLIIGKDGKLCKESNPDKPFRLFGFNGYPYWAKKIHLAKNMEEWKAAIDEYAELTRRQGYNMNRVVVYTTLSRWNTKNLLDLDSDEAWERFHYVANRFKEKGIYLYIFLDDVFYSMREGYSGTDLKNLMLIGDKETRDSWKKQVSKLLNTVNPYTKLAVKDDPLYACMEFQNEMGMALKPTQKKEVRDKLNRKFQNWLKDKYSDIYNLRLAWSNDKLESFDNITVNIGETDTPKAKDTAMFINYLYRSTAEWFTKTIREIGYKGLVAEYSLTWKWHYVGSPWRNLGVLEARYEFTQVAISNSYFSHPSNLFHKGSKVAQESSITKLADYWRAANDGRFFDRPFIQTEHNHCYWNQYKYEAGLVYSAYSAFQGFSGLTVHCNPVFFKREHASGAFLVGLSQVGRANQFLTACLFQREDITPARKKVAILIPPNAIGFKTLAEVAKIEDRDKLSLITGFGVTMPWAPRPEGVTDIVKPDMTISPVESSTVKSMDPPGTVFEPRNGKLDGNKILEIMRHRNIISKDNISDIKAGIFQSDTGEITLRQKEKLMKVVTRKTEAVALTKNNSEILDKLQVVGSTENACIAVTSMDKNSLGSSKKMVLLYITEDMNEGMELSGNRETMFQPGGARMLLKCGQFKIKLQNSNANSLKLYALSVTGKRMENIPFKSEGKSLSIDIDTAKLKYGPTVFFELSAE